jgi:hypothetical protein
MNRVTDRSEASIWLRNVTQHLSCPPHLTSADILVDVYDGNFTKPFQIPATIDKNDTKLKIVSLLQVNNSQEEYFNSSVAPQID